MKNQFRCLTLICGLLWGLFFLTNGYGVTPPATDPVVPPQESFDRDNRILKEVADHMGVPYKPGGSSRAGMDCSGFARYIYRQIFKIDLPYVAATQSRLPIFRDIPLKELKTGDLIYFTRTPKHIHINHVGIYLKDGEFAHAIEAKGVTVSRLNEPHWKIRVKTIKRLSPDRELKPL